jgi:hypothetical protein
MKWGCRKVGRSFRSVTGGRPLSFLRTRPHGLSSVPTPSGRVPGFTTYLWGEALAHAPKERENSGGGKFPSQISRRKDQAGSLGTEEKTSLPFPDIHFRS